MNFEDLIAKVKTCGKQKLAVAAAEDDAVLEAVDAAHKQGIADAILVGDEAAIRKIAAELNIDLSDYEIINEPDKVQASLKAVKLAHDGVANMYMKGLLDTKTFLKSVLDKEVGLRTGNTLSHVAVFEVKGIEQLLFLTDVAFMTYPTLEDKVHIIENTVAVAHALEHARVQLAGRSGSMRAADHQFQQSLVVGMMEKRGGSGVDFDVEGSGYGFKVVREISAARAEMPSQCRMKRF